MFRKLIAKILKFETKETVLELKREIAILSDKIATMEREYCDQENIIEELKKTIALFEELMEDETFISKQQKERYIEAKEKILSEDEVIESKPKPKRNHTPNTTIVVPQTKPEPTFTPIIPTETVSFIKNNKIEKHSCVNSRIEKIIEKLARIGLQVKYEEDQFFYIKDGISKLPLKERFTNLDVYGESALLLTDVNDIHAAYSLITGKRIGMPNKNKATVIKYLEEHFYPAKDIQINSSIIKDIFYYITLFDNLNSNKKGGEEAPHKRILLLSIIEAIKSGEINTPDIHLTSELRSIFKRVWDKYIPESSQFIPNPETPFRYMPSEAFWTYFGPKSSELNESADDKEFGQIDQELFDLILMPPSREILVQNLEDKLE